MRLLGVRCECRVIVQVFRPISEKAEMVHKFLLRRKFHHRHGYVHLRPLRGDRSLFDGAVQRAQGSGWHGDYVLHKRHIEQESQPFVSF